MEHEADLEATSYTDKDVLLPEESKEDIPPQSRPSKLKPHSRFLLIFTLICSIVSLIGFVALSIKSPFPRTPFNYDSNTCEHAMTRPEWRSLPPHRRHAYGQAVHRLTTLPSRLGLNTSLLDDFTYAHIQLPHAIHHVALSLPFHRLLLHVFENTLQQSGGYDGPIPYWDWTLDSPSPLDSPIFDPFSGLGGNGSPCTQFSPLGPKLANYSKDGYAPHCVTRNFSRDEGNGTMNSKLWSKRVVERIVRRSKSYDEFRSRLEIGPHNALHLGIGGEMIGSSSSNDPLFFVHHAQVDRLWWLWQQREEGRMEEFWGPKWIDNSTSEIEDGRINVGADGRVEEMGAGLGDMIRLFGLGEDRRVEEVMRTDTGLLCYKYKNEI